MCTWIDTMRVHLSEELVQLILPSVIPLFDIRRRPADWLPVRIAENSSALRCFSSELC